MILFHLFKAIFDYCQEGVKDQRELAMRVGEFNRTYKRATVAEQGEYHGMVAAFMCEDAP